MTSSRAIFCTLLAAAALGPAAAAPPPPPRFSYTSSLDVEKGNPLHQTSVFRFSHVDVMHLHMADAPLYLDLNVTAAFLEMLMGKDRVWRQNHRNYTLMAAAREDASRSVEKARAIITQMGGEEAIRRAETLSGGHYYGRLADQINEEKALAQKKQEEAEARSRGTRLNRDLTGLIGVGAGLFASGLGVWNRVDIVSLKSEVSRLHSSDQLLASGIAATNAELHKLTKTLRSSIRQSALSTTELWRQVEALHITNTMRHITQHLADTAAAAAVHRIAPAAIAPEEASSAIKEVDRKARSRHLRSILTQPAGLQELHATSMMREDTFTIVVNIPLAPEGEPFQLYLFHQLPFWAGGAWNTINAPRPYLAELPSPKTDYTTMDADQFSRCSHIAHHFVCPHTATKLRKNAPIHGRNDNLCLYNVYANRTDMARETCTLNLVHEDEFVMQLEEGLFAFFTKHEARIDIKCPAWPRSHSYEISGVHMVRLQPGCSASTPSSTTTRRTSITPIRRSSKSFTAPISHQLLELANFTASIRAQAEAMEDDLAGIANSSQRLTNYYNPNNNSSPYSSGATFGPQPSHASVLITAVVTAILTFAAVTAAAYCYNKRQVAAMQRQWDEYTKPQEPAAPSIQVTAVANPPSAASEAAAPSPLAAEERPGHRGSEFLQPRRLLDEAIRSEAAAMNRSDAANVGAVPPRNQGAQLQYGNVLPPPLPDRNPQQQQQ